MHKFERFIVYPLLIIALFYGMAGDQVMTNAKQVYDKIIAKEISIVNKNGQELINLCTEKDPLTDDKKANKNGRIIIKNIEGNGKIDLHPTILGPRIQIKYASHKDKYKYEETSIYSGCVYMGYEDEEGDNITTTRLTSSGYDYYYDNGNKAVSIGNTKSGNAGMWFYSNNKETSNSSIQITTNKYGSGALGISNKNGDNIFAVSNRKDTTGASLQMSNGHILCYGEKCSIAVKNNNLGISLYSEGLELTRIISGPEYKEKPLVNISQSQMAGGGIWLYDNGKSLVNIVANNKKGGFLGINNSHEDTSIMLTQNSEGHGGVVCFDKYGEDYTAYGYRD